MLMKAKGLSRDSQKMTLALIAILSFFLATGFVIYQHIQSAREASEVVIRDHETLLELTEILSLLRAAETGQRGFLLTGNEDYLDPYKMAAGRLESKINALAAKGPQSFSPRQLELLRLHAHAQLDELQETIDLRRTKGLAEALKVVRTDRGKADMDALIGIVSAMRRHHLRARAAAQEDMARRIALAELMTFSMSFLGAAITLWLGVLGRRIHRETNEYAAYLEETSRRKDEFLATLAHELRNPLAPLRNGLELLEGKLSAERAAQVKSLMHKQLDHMVRLIDDLLDMARVSQGRIELRKQPITVQKIVDAAVDTVSPAIAAAGHQLNLHLPEEDIWISADLIRMSQAVTNLLTNAVKYTPPRGAIDITAWTEHGEAFIAVKDNGIGIEPGAISRVFDLFTQIEGSIEKSHGGLGIGLSLSRRLVQMHGGDITARSDGEGKGSTFTIHVPLPPREESHDKAQPEARPVPRKKMKVLVVDDNRDSAQTLGWTMEASGHEVAVAYDGAEALEVARKFHPDAILLDIGLPEVNGYDVCRSLRREDDFKHTMIIAQTGWGADQDRQKSREAGFDAHLVKPIDFADINRILTEGKAA